MKKIIVSGGVLLALAVGGYVTANAWGQNPQASSPSLPIGLVDIGAVFENYEKFARQREQFRAEVEQERSKFVTLRDRLKQLEDQRKRFNPESPEYQQYDDQITEERARLEAELRQAERRFAQKESTLVHNTYMEVLEMVRAVARHYNLALVVRYRDDEPMTPSNPREVQEGINRQILYHDPGMDITQIVLRTLNDRYQQSLSRTNQPPPSGGASAPRTANSSNRPTR